MQYHRYILLRNDGRRADASCRTGDLLCKGYLYRRLSAFEYHVQICLRGIHNPVDHNDLFHNKTVLVRKQKGQYSVLLFAVAIGFAICLFIPAHYTMVSLKQRCGDLKRENYRTLDGTAYIESYTSNLPADHYAGNLKPYMECVNWFNNNVKVILTAASYLPIPVFQRYSGGRLTSGFGASTGSSTRKLTLWNLIRIKMSGSCTSRQGTMLSINYI